MEASIHNTLEFCYWGEEWNGVIARGGGMREIFLFYMQRAKFREMKCLTEAHTAGLGQRGVASRSLAPNTVLFLPYSCCLFLADIMKVLGYRPSRWSTCSYGNSRTLELEGLALPLDLTDLLSHFYLLSHFSCHLLWHKTSSRHVPGSSLWSRADHPAACLPLEGLPMLWT